MSISEIRLSPLKMVFDNLKHRGFAVEKVADSEISTEINDFPTPFQFSTMYNEELNSLMVSCHIRHTIPQEKYTSVIELLSRLNTSIWMGHYELAPEDDLVGYRYTLNLAGVKYPTDEQVDSMIDAAIVECVRIYPALKFILVDGKSASEAAVAAMMETVGEA